jgi:hypothetical protein
MTVKTVTTWTIFPSQEVIDQISAKIQEYVAEGVVVGHMATTPNPGGFANNTPPMVAYRLWTTAAAAQAWVDYLATVAPDGNTTETMLGVSE